MLAIDRGERENVLKVKLAADKDQQIAMIDRCYVRNKSQSAALVKAAGEDALSRLIFPALEREIRGMLTDNAGFRVRSPETTRHYSQQGRKLPVISIETNSRTVGKVLA